MNSPKKSNCQVSQRRTENPKLNTILDIFENANKKDVYDYSIGHLNENHLYKFPKSDLSHQPWRTSSRDKCPVLQSCSKKQQGTSSHRSTKKVSILKPIQKQSSSTLPQINQKISPKEYLDSKIPLNVSPGGISINVSDTECSETRESPDYFHNIYAFQPSANISWLKNLVVPSHMLKATKKDHYESMKEFQTNVVGKLGTFDRNKLTGSKMISRMMKKLEMNLKQCPPTDDGSLSLKRLECFSNSFEDLIANSPAFGSILKAIKAEYDNYISYLLDIHLSHGKILQEEVQQMSQGSLPTQLSLSQAKQKLEELESSAVELLQTTARLQKEIDDENVIANAKNLGIIKEELVKPITPQSSVDVYTEVELLRVAILSRMDELNSTRENILENYVPISVCNNLEHCIKETEVELQKLIKQNEYYERSSSEMEGYLKEAIIEADTSDRDVRRIWRKIYSCKNLQESDEMKKFHRTYESDEDDDHESKWNWYIS